MTTIDKIRAEIKERIALQKDLLKQAEDSARIEGSIDALQGLLNNMDTLSEEPVSEDLEEAAEESWIYYEYRDSGHLYSSVYKDAFKAGAEWDAEHFRDTTKKVSKDLEEAAKEYDEAESWRYEALKYPRREAFEAGANWQKRQIMKNTIDIKVIESYNPTCEPNERLHGISFIYDCKNDNQYLIAGDRAKIIIVKEEEQ